jgi:hypothetical protein
MEEYGKDREATDYNMIWGRKHSICMIDSYDKNTYTHSYYLIITTFPRQQRLRERAWMFSYTYIVCLDIVTAIKTAIPLREKHNH